MKYWLDYRPYRRSFRQALQTSHGAWSVREGIVLKLTNEAGQSGFGEIAPLAWFGSETLSEACEVCQKMEQTVDAEAILSIPDRWPACQFGFESAWENLTASKLNAQVALPANCLLLPTGAIALTSPLLRLPDAATFKWKIGVANWQDELKDFQKLLRSLPSGSSLRLDANGGLTWDQACYWLEACDAASIVAEIKVEFLEQPLPPSQFDAMLGLSARYQTPLALDESVATLHQLQTAYANGWRGIFVVKAAIAGSPRRLREFCQQQPLDVVWSSVFETAIARQYIENYLIRVLPHRPRAFGFGVDHWFTDAIVQPLDFEQLWQSL